MAVLSNAGDAGKGDQWGRKGGPRSGNNQTNIFNIVKMIMERNFAPVIIFSFSKKECEIYAMQMAKLDFNTSEYFAYYNVTIVSILIPRTEAEKGIKY